MNGAVLTEILLPAPRRVRVPGGVGAPEPVVVRAGCPPGAPRRVRDQSFRLRITPGGVAVEAGGPAGERYAREALRQIREWFGAAVPCVEIEDWPSVPVRGVMLDVSRCRVPTMGFLEGLIAVLARLRVNHLELYLEHAFAYAGHEEVWAGASPMTGEEVRRLDALAREAGIELAANQNCFGHMERWLRHGRYAALAEIQGDVPWPFGSITKRGPFSLCPLDPGSLALVEDLLGQLLPCFESERVNIGCDETLDVGHGRSRAEVERVGRGAVWARFVGEVAGVVRRHGKRPMLWADALADDPGLIERVGLDAEALVWGYEPDSPLEEQAEGLRRRGARVWVCPGTSAWRSIVGRTSERCANIERAVRAAESCGAEGVLITEWGDMGHHQQWPVSLGAMAWGAACAWSGRGPDARAVSRGCFGDRSGRWSAWLDALGDADAEIRRVGDGSGPIRNSGALFLELHGLGEVGTVAAWEGVRERLGALASEMPAAPDGLMEREARWTVALAQASAEGALARRRGDAGACVRLAERMEGLREEFCVLWRQRSRPGGLAESVGHLERAAARLRACAGVCA